MAAQPSCSVGQAFSLRGAFSPAPCVVGLAFSLPGAFSRAPCVVGQAFSLRGAFSPAPLRTEFTLRPSVTQSKR